MAKWITKQFAGKWVTRCPYCNHMKAYDSLPPETWICQCKAIVNGETYKRLTKLSRALSTLL
uniref:Uncharacterized protein n=1 Tax=viral metagenome TaxID=1070528 RepID=A0A6M3LV03_9ZZZZ